MKRTWWQAGGLLLTVALTIVLAGISNSAQNTGLTAQDERAVRNAVGKKGPISLNVVVQEFTGSFENVEGYMDRFLKEFEGQEAARQITTSAGPFMRILEDPTGKSSFRMEIGLTVQERLPVREPLKFEQIRYAEAVRYNNVGSYDKLPRIYRIIEKSLRKNPGDWQPVMLLNFDSPKKGPDKTKAEMIVPARR